jgi:hypothetical protein
MHSKRRFWKMNKRRTLDFRSTFQGREYSIWGTNNWKVIRKSGVLLLSIPPKSSFGRGKLTYAGLTNITCGWLRVEYAWRVVHYSLSKTIARCHEVFVCRRLKWATSANSIAKSLGNNCVWIFSTLPLASVNRKGSDIATCPKRVPKQAPSTANATGSWKKRRWLI